MGFKWGWGGSSILVSKEDGIINNQSEERITNHAILIKEL